MKQRTPLYERLYEGKYNPVHALATARCHNYLVTADARHAAAFATLVGTGIPTG
jgi:hypothetical protein